MMMKQLVTVVEEVCVDLGYKFYCGTQKQINSTVKKLPVVWMEYPSITKISGRNQGSITYEVSLYLMRDIDPKNALELASQLEDQAVTLYNLLAQHQRVRSVDDLETSVNYMIFPPLGEMSLHAEFEITLDFILNCNIYD